MNSFGLDIDNLDSQEIAEATSPRSLGYERLPGVPAILSRADCAAISGVSLPTIERLVASGELTETRFFDGDFGILRDDFAAFLDANMLCNRPVMEEEEEPIERCPRCGHDLDSTLYVTCPSCGGQIQRRKA